MAVFNRKTNKFIKERRKIREISREKQLTLPSDLFGKYIHSDSANFLRTVKNNGLNGDSNLQNIMSGLMGTVISSFEDEIRKIKVLEENFLNFLKMSFTKYSNLSDRQIKNEFLKTLLESTSGSEENSFKYIKDVRYNYIERSVANNKGHSGPGPRVAFEELKSQLNDIANSFDLLIKELNKEQDFINSKSKTYSSSLKSVLEKNNQEWANIKKSISNHKNSRENLSEASKKVFSFLGKNAFFANLGNLAEPAVEKGLRESFMKEQVLGGSSNNVQIPVVRAVGAEMKNSGAVMDISIGEFGGINLKSQSQSFSIPRKMNRREKTNFKILDKFLSRNVTTTQRNSYLYMRRNVEALKIFNSRKESKGDEFSGKDITALREELFKLDKSFFGSYYLISIFSGIAEDVTSEKDNWRSLIFLSADQAVFMSDLFSFLLSRLKMFESGKDRDIFNSKIISQFIEAKITRNRKNTSFSEKTLASAYKRKLGVKRAKNDDSTYRLMANKIKDLMSVEMVPLVSTISYKVKFAELFKGRDEVIKL